MWCQLKSLSCFQLVGSPSGPVWFGFSWSCSQSASLAWLEVGVGLQLGALPGRWPGPSWSCLSFLLAWHLGPGIGEGKSVPEAKVSSIMLYSLTLEVSEHHQHVLLVIQATLSQGRFKGSGIPSLYFTMIGEAIICRYFLFCCSCCYC